MYRSFALFKKNIEDVKNLSTLHAYLKKTITSPFTFDDILRSQIVYAISAFDKLIHDLVRIGIVEIYMGIRTATPKYLAEPISMELHGNLNAASIPPKEHVFDKIIFNKLKVVSYQDPAKISDGLSYIWIENQKWKKISETLAMKENDVKVKLKLIVSRRNSIVHEADIDPITNKKMEILEKDSDDTVEFLRLCGESIFNMVKIN